MKESHNIEFKSSWRDEYLKVISAFANTEGGKLYIGLDDTGNLLGVENSKKLLEDIPNKIKSKLLITPFVNLEEINGKEVILIDILPSSFPIYYEGRVYIRSGSSLQELTGMELTTFLLEKTGKTWDALPIDANFEEIDLETIDRFKELAKNRLPLISQENSYEKILRNLKLINDDGKLTRAAIILFGKNPQKFFIMAKTRIGKFKTPEMILDTMLTDGNLFKQLDMMMVGIKKHLNVRFDTNVRGFATEGFARKDIWDYPIEAIREAVINALIHRDYLVPAEIQIKIYDDKIIFGNPGKLVPPLTINQLRGEHSSRQRNPLIATTFYYAGFIEAWGSGTMKMINFCRNQDLPEPEFIERREGNGEFVVTFFKNFYNEEMLIKAGLSERQIKIVLLVKENNMTNISSLKKSFPNISEKTLYRDLQDLVKKNILVQEGEKKGRKYKLR